MELGPDDFIYGGYLYRRAGRECWYVQSRSHPGSVYFTDAEAGECSCWAFTRNPARPCGHLRLIEMLKAKLKNTHTNGT